MYLYLFIYHFNYNNRNDPSFSIGVGKPHDLHFIRLHNFNSHSFIVDNKKYSVFLNKAKMNTCIEYKSIIIEINPIYSIIQNLPYPVIINDKEYEPSNNSSKYPIYSDSMLCKFPVNDSPILLEIDKLDFPLSFNLRDIKGNIIDIITLKKVENDTLEFCSCNDINTSPLLLLNQTPFSVEYYQQSYIQNKQIIKENEMDIIGIDISNRNSITYVINNKHFEVYILSFVLFFIRFHLMLKNQQEFHLRNILIKIVRI